MARAEQSTSGLILPLNADISTLSPETHSIPKPPIYFTEDRDELRITASEPGMKWFYEREFGLYVICPEEYKTESKPKQHTDKYGNIISSAVYYIDEYFTQDGYAIYLSYLAPGRMTSEAHRHSKDMIEHYQIIKGSAEITLGYGLTQTVQLNDSSNYVRIPFGMGHRMKALNDGALTLIRTENPHNLLPGTLHLRDEVPSII